MISPESGLAQRLRAEASFRLGRFDEVVRSLDRYLEKGKPLESVYRGRGLARAELGHIPARSKISPRRSNLHPTSAVQAFRGWTYLVSDAPKLALRDFELAIDARPQERRCLRRPGVCPGPAGPLQRGDR